MDTNEFVNMTAPEVLYVALEPIAPLIGAGACVNHDPEQFASPERQQAAFFGEAVDPAADYPAARSICLACPVLAACRRYADDSCDEQTFLGGLTAGQRSARRLKRTEIAKRRLQVSELRALGAPTSVIADLVNRDPSLIRGDVRALEKQARPAIQRVRPSAD